MNDLISIITVYNVEAYLDRLMLSVVTQTYKNLEIILVDDGSTDRSGKICDDWAAKDNRIQVIHTRNKGVAAARNYGLSIANGEYIGFADPDDWVDETMFECLLDTLKRFKADIVICGFEEVKNSKAIIKQVKYTRCYTRDEALYELVNDKEIQNYVWNKLFVKKCIPVNPFPEIKRISDLAGMYKFFRKAESVVHINKSFYHYIRRDGSLENGTLDSNICYSMAIQKQCEGLQDESEAIRELVAAKYIAALGNTKRLFLSAETVMAKEYYPILEKTLYSFYVSHLEEFRKLKGFTEEKEMSLTSFLKNPEIYCKKTHTKALNLNEKKKSTDVKNKIDTSKDIEIKKLKNEISRIKRSYSYRIGRVATFLPIIIRDFCMTKKR